MPPFLLALLPFWNGAKSICGALLTFFSKPPGSYIGIALAIAGWQWWFGQHEFNRGKQACQAKTAIAEHQLINDVLNINVSLGNLFIPKFIVIATETQRVKSEIPQHVSPQIDRSYLIPLGFVRVWNDRSHGSIPPTAAGGDADPSGVPISTVADAGISNIGALETCRAINDEWWSWYDRNKAAFDKAHGVAK